MAGADVLTELEPRQRDTTLHRAAPSALADRPVTYATQTVAAERGVVSSQPDVLDTDPVERARQSRLRLWQRQPAIERGWRFLRAAAGFEPATCWTQRRSAAGDSHVELASALIPRSGDLVPLARGTNTALHRPEAPMTADGQQTHHTPRLTPHGNLTAPRSSATLA